MPLIDNLHSLLLSFFPGRNADIFNVLSTNSLTIQITDISAYADTIIPLAIRFGINGNKISIQFANLLRSIITDHKDKYCELKFWQFIGVMGFIFLTQILFFGKIIFAN